jgi:hypothetical protein
MNGRCEMLQAQPVNYERSIHGPTKPLFMILECAAAKYGMGTRHGELKSKSSVVVLPPH